MGKLKSYVPTKFKAKNSVYSKEAADRAVCFIESLKHTDGVWYKKPFELLDWQEQIIRDVFGILKPNGYRQFNTAYIEIPKKQGKSELAAAVALLLTCADFEEGAQQQREISKIRPFDFIGTWGNCGGCMLLFYPEYHSCNKRSCGDYHRRSIRTYCHRHEPNLQAVHQRKMKKI